MGIVSARATIDRLCQREALENGNLSASWLNITATGGLDA